MQFFETNRNLLLKTHYVWREGKDQYIKWFVSISASKKQCEKKCTTRCIFCNETFFVYSRVFLNRNDRWTSQEKREFFTIIRRRLINLSSTNSQVLNALCKLEGHVSKMMSDSEKKRIQEILMIVFLAMKWSGNFEAGQEKDLKQKLYT